MHLVGAARLLVPARAAVYNLIQVGPLYVPRWVPFACPLPYNYIVLGYDKDKAAEFVAHWRPARPRDRRTQLDARAFPVGQCNICLRMNTRVFTHAALSDERQWQIVPEEELAAAACHGSVRRPSRTYVWLPLP